MGSRVCANFPYSIPSGEQDVPLHRPFQGRASELHGAQDGEGNRGVLRPGHALQLQGAVSFAIVPRQALIPLDYCSRLPLLKSRTCRGACFPNL